METAREFQTWIDWRGDLWCRAGTVVCVRDGQIHPVAGSAGSAFPPTSAPGMGDGWVKVPRMADTLTCVGGSGNNVTVTCAVAGVPAGLFQPTGDGEWGCAAFPDASLEWYPDGTTELYDGTGKVADAGTDGSTLGPQGTLVATTYGRDTYNGGAAFNVTLAYEGGGGWSTAAVAVSAGTMTAGNYPGTDAETWTHETDSDWQILPDGTDMIITDGADTVAIRTGGSRVNPSGYYATTEYGRDTYHGGDDFSVAVTASPPAPVSGVVYITVREASAGVVSSVGGPYFAATLPAPTTSTFHVPVATIGVGGAFQITEGPVMWGKQFIDTRPPGADAGGAVDGDLDGGTASTTGTGTIDGGSSTP